MGAGFARNLSKVVPNTGRGSAWQQRDVGPSLRRFFGAYVNGDFWAVYRRYKNVDKDQSGFVSFEELQSIVKLPEFNLLFIWDAFSQQNALMRADDLLVMVCLFSSAKLGDKCRFFMTLFDNSHSGSVTGEEVSQIVVSCFSVLSRCTGAPFRPKDVIQSVSDDLPDVLPEYREAAKRLGSQLTFKKERLISQAEIDKIIESIQSYYQALPIGEPPPSGAVPPPPPDWGSELVQRPSSAAGGGAAAVKALRGSGTTLTEADLAHFAAVSSTSLRDEEPTDDGESLLQQMEQVKLQRAELKQALEARKANEKPVKGWFVIHGTEFSSIAKDLPSFRHSFIKNISQALGIHSRCIEVLDIVAGSIVVEFLVHPPSLPNDQRSGKELLILLAQQLTNSNSFLLRGNFGHFASSAELLAGQTRATAVPTLSIDDVAVVCCNQAVQFMDPFSLLEEVMQRLAIEKQRAEEAEAAEKVAVDALKQLQVTFNELFAKAKAKEVAEFEEAKQRDDERARHEAKAREEELELVRQALQAIPDALEISNENAVDKDGGMRLDDPHIYYPLPEQSSPFLLRGALVDPRLRDVGVGFSSMFFI